MQCPSCQFENMPGSGRCARCGTSLALATAAIDVHPPRAGRLSRLELAFWRIWRRIGRLRWTVSMAFAAARMRSAVTYFDWITFIRCIIPGWAQYHRGEWLRAVLFLFAYLCLLLPGLMLTGSGIGALFVGLAAALHIAAVCDAVVTMFATPRDRIAFTIVCGLLLSFGVYLPLGWLVSRVATPIRINATIPPFQQGEVLWYNRLATPARGDLVVFSLPQISARNYVFQGQWIGRVIAMPGQAVSIENGRWLMDGIDSKWQPNVHPALSHGYSCVVPDGHVLVYPDGLVPAQAPVNIDQLEQMYIVPTARIAGRLYFRSLPFSKMSTL